MEVSQRKLTAESFRMGLCLRVLWLAAIVLAGLSNSSGPLNSRLCDPERVSGETDSWSS